MPVHAMTCLSVEKHPHADKLFVYSFRNKESTHPIVANDDNNYNVGDVAAVVTSGLLKDGTKIRPALIRGVMSHGMAIEKVQAKEGDDLSDKYLASGVFHKAWPDISLLYVIRKYIHDYHVQQKVYNYRAKVKLDGTNAGIQVLRDGSIHAQSRTAIITPEDDNMGFARWTFSNQSYWSSLAGTHDIVIFGEWAGKGIQKRCSISSIDKKVFCVFAIQIDPDTDASKLLISPSEIEKILGTNKPSDVFVLPWYGDVVTMDYTTSDTSQACADVINKMVNDVEQCDPWVKDTFGISGLGEGVVLYPCDEDIIDREFYSNFVFKAKGEKHNVVNVKAPATINPEVLASTDAFVKLFVTENRLEQFSGKTGFDAKKIGEFIKLFSADVEKESKAELEASNLQWKDVSKAVMGAARKWYLEKVQTS